MVLPLDLVRGIITADKLIRHRDYDVDAGYHLRRHQLPERAATGITAFFANCYTAPPAKSTTPSRALLLQMVQQGANIPPALPSPDSCPIRLYEDTQFEAGQTYVIGSSASPRYQGVVGLDRPQQNIAVLGREKRELVISDTAALCDALGATLIHELLPPTAPEPFV